MKLLVVIVICLSIIINSTIVIARPNKTLSTKNSGNNKSSPGQTTEADSKSITEIKTLIKEFTKCMEEKKDFSLLIDRFCVSNYQNIIVDILYKDLKGEECNVYKQLNQSDFYNYYIANINFYYLTFLYIASNYDLETTSWSPNYIDGIEFKKRYPREVVNIISKNNTLLTMLNPKIKQKENVELTQAQLQLTISTIEQSVIAMRKYLQEHRPENSVLYKKNMKYLSGVAGILEILENKWYKEDGTILEEGTPIFFTLLPGALKLNFVKTDGKYKILAVFVDLCG